MKRSRLVVIAIAIFMLLISAVSLVSCSNKDEDVIGIKSIKLNKKGDKVTLKATLDKDFVEKNSKETLYLLALPCVGDDDSLDGAIVIDQTRAKRKLKFKFELYDGDVSRISYGFVIAKKNGNSYTPITDVSYIENPESLAQSEKGSNSTAGIKGLATNDVYSALAVGAEHVLIDARIDTIMLPGFEKGAIDFNYNGTTYYFDREYVEELEDRVKDANALGMRVYFRTTLGMTDEKDKESDASVRIYPKSLYCKGAEAGKKGYLPNLSNKDTANWIKAFYAFMSSRYSVSDFIIGDNVNHFAEYCNAGDLTQEEFEKIYYFWARTAHIILSTNNSSAKVYIPIDNYWNADSKNGHIASKAFITGFAKDAEASGDYPYAVAFDLGDGEEDIKELLSGTDHDYDTLGVKSLGEVANYLKKKEFEFDGDSRKMIIDDLFLPVGSMTEQNRAAYYTFAYYTAAKNGFSAFITSSDAYSGTGKRSDFYYALLMCGSDKSSQLSGYVNKLKDVSTPSFDDYKTLDLTYSQSALFEIKTQDLKKQKDFPVEFENFTRGGSAFKSQILTVTDQNGNSQKLWKIEADCANGVGAVSSGAIRAKELIRSGYIGITMSAQNTARVAIIITNESAKTAAYIGETEVASAPETYYFNISDFAKDAKASDMIKISICLIPDGDDEEAVTVSKIALYGTSGRGAGTVIVIIVVSVVVVALIGTVVFLSVKRKKTQGKNIKAVDGDEE